MEDDTDYATDPAYILRSYGCDDQVSSLAAVVQTNHTSGRVVELAIRLAMVIAIHAAERRFALQEAHLDQRVSPFSPITYRDLANAKKAKESTPPKVGRDW